MSDPCVKQGFTIFPVNASDILEHENLNKHDKEKLVDLLSEVKSKTTIENPISLSPGRPQSVKIMRILMDDIDAKMLSRKYGLSVVYGDGSRGNRGHGNRGSAFEQLAFNDFLLYKEDRLGANFKYPDMMQFMHYNLLKDKDFEVSIVGAECNKRPIMIQKSGIYFGSRKLNIGRTIADIIVTTEKEHYLSCKMGNTVKFFNIGIGKIFPQREFLEGRFKSETAHILLKTLSIDEDKFINTFNSYENTGANRYSSVRGNSEIIDITDKLENNVHLRKMLMSGIGVGYWKVQKLGKDVYCNYMDVALLKRALRMNKATITYPELGKGKQITINIYTDVFRFIIELRDDHGGIYPNQIKGGYKYAE